MKITNYKFIFILLLIPFLSFSNGNLRGKYKKTKEVSKTFNTTNSTILNIKNKYGNVDIATWNKNIIEIEVTITVSGNDEDEIENKLKKIYIDFDKSGNDVYATTHVDGKKSNSWFSNNWFSWGNNSNINFQIDYKIRMPIENNLDITNEYGSIIIDELNGETNIQCDYGKIIAGKLNNVNNEIHFDYTRHSSFEFINKARIYADYSGFTVEKANYINLKSDYSSCRFEEIKKLKFNGDFGSLKVIKADYIIGNGDYGTFIFVNVYKSIDVNTSFGTLKIDKLMEGFESVEINTDYTGVKIGIDSNASCNINSELSYGSFHYDGELFNFNRIREKSSNKSYEGYFNNKNNNATITTNTEFGSVKMYQR